MSDRPPAPDQAARDRLAQDFGTTLFVEAGAGSGKTTTLVDRVLALVATGEEELEHIAAVTFTEKAATELRDRLRRQFEETADEAGDLEVAARCRRALEQLDGAAVGTLHSFAQRLLTEHPLEARLPPRFEILDEVSSDVAFEERWSVFLDELLADGEYEPTLVLFFACGSKVEALRAVAAAFDDNWDLVEERVVGDPPNLPDVRALVDSAVARVKALCATPCRDPEDKLRRRLDAILTWVQRLANTDDDRDLLDAIGPDAEPPPPSFKVGGAGRQANYSCDVALLQQQVRDAGKALSDVRGTVAEACVKRLAVAIADFTMASAEQRRRSGRLEFHDLLVLARELLCDTRFGPAVRARLHERYRRLLLDESQDTDPIQIELAVRIAAADPRREESGAAPWQEVEVSPGQLFFVGDPKQSIYRFRRADIVAFMKAKQRFGAETRGLVELTANFRSTQPLIGWVNAVFGTLFTRSASSAIPLESQPDYLALDAVRPAAPVGPAVCVLGREEHPYRTRADDMRRAEAAEVAATIARMVAEGWEVGTDDQGTGGTGWRPARLGDITVLVPARTSLPFLEDALQDTGIAYRAESSSLVYATRAVRDLLLVLRAVDDPTNSLNVMSALRTPLLGCGDDDLFRFKVERRGRWGYLADQPDTVPDDDPVRAGLSFLRTMYDERHFLSPSELLDRIATDRRAFELGFAEGRPRDVWRRLRFVVDQARAWHEATGGNLREYLRWVEHQASEGARVEEVVLPETDDDAVRIMTIHAAKGLEFPITIVSGLSTAPRANWSSAQVLFPPTGPLGYRLGKGVVTSEYEAWIPIDEQMASDERIRLLYVACTRARDHLVVSLHRAHRKDAAKAGSETNAELLVSATDTLLDDLPDGALDAGPVVVPTPAAPTGLPPFEEWSAARTAALKRASRPTTVAATALTEEGNPDAGDEPAEGLKKRPRDLDLPPWLKGRYGSAVGRAVHGVLQAVDLATGDGIEAGVAAQCEAEAVVDRAEDVARLVIAALRSPTVVEAAASPYWRELYVCVPLAERLLEGYLDLLYRRPEGLVVVDYKTSSSADPAELDRRVEGYRLQGASYALAVSEATGETVVAVVFVFLTPDGAVERELHPLDEAMAEVRRLVGAGEELVVA